MFYHYCNIYLNQTNKYYQIRKFDVDCQYLKVNKKTLQWLYNKATFLAGDNKEERRDPKYENSTCSTWSYICYFKI